MNGGLWGGLRSWRSLRGCWQGLYMSVACARAIPPQGVLASEEEDLPVAVEETYSGGFSIWLAWVACITGGVAQGSRPIR